MGTKVYFLVEAEESNADPVSRMMTQFLDKLKTKDPCCQTYPPPENSKAIFSTIPLRAPEPIKPTIKSCHAPKPKILFKELAPGDCFSSGSGKICSEVIPCPKTHGVKSAIVAEAVVDNTGQANAKISVNSDATKKDISSAHLLCKVDSPPRNTYAFCERRNGLEPTLSELRGANKVFYVPIKGKIGQKNKCPNFPSILSDNISSTSICSRSSGYYYNRNLPMVAEMKKCAWNIPEARLIKYNACISRRDGMQDRCDPLSRKALRKCCKK